jgi:hypothetical protein
MNFVEFIIQELNDQEENDYLEYDDYSIGETIEYTTQE